MLTTLFARRSGMSFRVQKTNILGYLGLALIFLFTRGACSIEYSFLSEQPSWGLSSLGRKAKVDEKDNSRIYELFY